jgi:hypothetical protein
MALITSMPPCIEQPVVIESFGIPEVYGDGGIIRIGDLLAETIVYREFSIGQEIERQAVLRIIMPKHGFDLSLVRAYLVAMGGVRH